VKRIILVTLTVLLVSAIIFGGCAKPAEPTTPTTPTEPTKPPVKPIEWRYASFIPPMDTYAYKAIDWAKELEEATDGRMKILFYWSESLIKMPGLFDALTSGTAHMGHFSYAQQPERFALAMGMTLPMLFRRPPQMGQAAVALYNKYKEFRDPFGPTKLLWHNSPGPGGTLVTKDVPVQTMEDLKGLKLSSTSKYEILSYNLLGAVVVPVGVGERYHALETGVVDGSIEDWVAIFMWKSYEVTKYRTENIDLTMRGFPTAVNTEAYNKLPEDIKQIFDGMTDPMGITKTMNEDYEVLFLEYRDDIKEYDAKVGNPPFNVLTEAERERWKTVVSPLQDEWAEEMEAKGLPGKAILADMKAFAEQYK